MRASPTRAIWTLRVLLGVSAAYLLIPTPLDSPAWWPLFAAACAALLGFGVWVAVAVREQPADFAWRDLTRVPESLEANLAVLAAVGLAVKAAVSAYPLAPLLFFLFLPISVFPSRIGYIWIPSALLAAMTIGPYLRDGALGLVPWAVAFIVFSCGFVKGSSEREKYRKMVVAHKILEEDTIQLRKWIKEKDRFSDLDHPDHERTFDHAAVTMADRLLGDLMRWAAVVFEARTALILVPSGDDRFRMRHGGGRGVVLREDPIPSDKGFLNHALMRDDGVLLVNDARAAAGSLAFYAPGVEVGSLAVKVVFEERQAGSPKPGRGQPRFAIYLDRSATDGFIETPDLKRRLESFASLVDGTLSMVEDLGSVFTRYKSGRSIAKHASGLTVTLDAEVMAEHALDSLREVLPDCEASAFLLGSGPVRVASVRGDAFAGIEKTQVTAREPSLVGHLLRLAASPSEAAPARCEIVQNNIDRGRKVHLFTEKETVGRVASFAALPCMVKQEEGSSLRGVLAAASSKPGLFTEERLADLRTLTNITAPALDNAFTHLKIKEMSRVDGLTGLLNHRTLQTVLESKVKRMSRGYEASFALIMADADHFKRINDSYGHPVGDEVLRELARRLRTGIRETDRVARYGGEEFVVILDKADWAEAGAVAEKIRRLVEEAPFETQAGRLDVTISAGFCVYPSGGEMSRQELIDRADRALYAAKRAGRNRVVAYREIAEDSAISR